MATPARLSRPLQIRFGTDWQSPPPPGDNPAAKGGVFSRLKAAFSSLGEMKGTARMLWDHLKHAENRVLIKGLLYQYGVPAAVGLAFMMPFGWFFGAMASVPAYFISKRGEKIVNGLNLDKQSGPLAKITRMQQIWFNNEENAPTKLMNKFNELLDDLFPDKPAGEGGQGAKSMAPIREKLRMTENSKLFDLLDRVFNARNRGLKGAIVRGVEKLSSSKLTAMIRPLQVPLRILSIALLGLFMLFNRRGMAKVASQAIRRVA